MLKAFPLPGQADAAAQQSADEHGRRNLFSRGRPDADLQLARTAAGVDAVTITAGGSAVLYHGMNRLPQGWYLVDVSTAVDLPLYRSAWTTTTITIQNPGSVDFAGKVAVL